jgi:hypothetical protein
MRGLLLVQPPDTVVRGAAQTKMLARAVVPLAVVVAMLCALTTPVCARKLEPPHWYPVDSDADFEDLVIEHAHVWLVLFSREEEDVREFQILLENAVHPFQESVGLAHVYTDRATATAEEYGVGASHASSSPSASAPRALLFTGTSRRAYHQVRIGNGVGSPAWLETQHDIQVALTHNPYGARGRYEKVARPHGISHDEL